MSACPYLDGRGRCTLGCALFVCRYRQKLNEEMTREEAYQALFVHRKLIPQPKRPDQMNEIELACPWDEFKPGRDVW